MGTYRDVELDTRHPLERTLAAMNRERLHERLSLRRLTEPAVAQMVATLLDEPAAPTPPPHPSHPLEGPRRPANARARTLLTTLVAVLHHETEGNPFFIEEVLKHLVEEGAIYREGGRWQIRRPEEFSVPQSIKVTIERRLERLGPESRETLTLAAVIGQQFTFDVLLKASGLDEDRLLDTIDEWRGAHLVVEQRVGREEVYRFQHAQIRAVLVDALGLRRKVRLHERVGAALEEVYAASLEEHLDELAYHFSQIHTGPGVEKAVEYCLRAGQRARHLSADEEAVNHLTAALELLDELPDDETHLRLRWQVVENLDAAHVSRQERERGRGVLQEYLTRAESVGYWWGVAAAYCQMGGHPYWNSESLERAMEVAERHGLTGWLASARIRLAMILTTPGNPLMRDFSRAQELLRQTLRTPEDLPGREIQQAYAALMRVCAGQEKWEEAAAVFRESLAAGGPAVRWFCWYLSQMEDALAGARKQDEFRDFCEEAKRLLSQAGLSLSLNQWYLEAAQPSGEFQPLRFHDDFDEPQLASEWSWCDPSRTSAFSLTQKPGYLTIRAAPGSDLWPPENLSAPRLLREVGGDFALETRMEGDWDERRERSFPSGLLIWKDALNFLRLDKFALNDAHHGDVYLAGRIKGAFLHFGRGRMRGGIYFLRLERIGEQFTALCSTDGEQWLTCGTVHFAAGDPLLVGVHAGNGMVAHFDYVRVLGRGNP